MKRRISCRPFSNPLIFNDFGRVRAARIFPASAAVGLPSSCKGVYILTWRVQNCKVGCTTYTASYLASPEELALLASLREEMMLRHELARLLSGWDGVELGRKPTSVGFAS